MELNDNIQPKAELTVKAKKPDGKVIEFKVTALLNTEVEVNYSRRELGFVDDLVSKLESEGYNVWLDYRVLVPGTPWKEQIAKGLERSDTVLLVVSKASLASKYVTLEWQHTSLKQTSASSF